MSTRVRPGWDSKRTDETRNVENSLLNHFKSVEAYRYNSASIRIRVIDPCFRGLDRHKREKIVDAKIAKLPESIQRDIVFVLCMTPDEMIKPIGDRDDTEALNSMFNDEFEHPKPSRL